MKSRKTFAWNTKGRGAAKRRQVSITHQKAAAQQGPRQPEASKLDPSRTADLRRKLAAEIERRFAKLRHDVYQIIGEQDYFGLGQQNKVANSVGGDLGSVTGGQYAADGVFNADQPRDEHGRFASKEAEDATALASKSMRPLAREATKLARAGDAAGAAALHRRLAASHAEMAEYADNLQQHKDAEAKHRAAAASLSGTASHGLPDDLGSVSHQELDRRIEAHLAEHPLPASEALLLRLRLHADKQALDQRRGFRQEGKPDRPLFNWCNQYGGPSCGIGDLPHAPEAEQAAKGDARLGGLARRIGKVVGDVLRRLYAQELPAWAMEHADVWAYENCLNAARPGTTLAVKVAGWAVAKAWQAAKKLTGNEAVGNQHADHGLQAVAVQLLQAMAQISDASGFGLPTLEELTAELEGRRDGAVQNFNPEQHRDSHGRWTAGDGSTSENQPDFTQEHFLGVRRVVNDVVANWKYKHSVNVTQEDGPEFEVAGMRCREAGNCHLSSSFVTVRTPRITSVTQAQNVAAHEVMHGMYEHVHRRYRKEQEALAADPDEVIKPTGELKPEFRDRYPTYARMFPYLDGSTLGATDWHEKDDGVTPYSEAYWRGVKKGTVMRHIAVHETLAEIAANNESKGVVLGTKRYRDFYKAVKDEYRVITGSQDKRKGVNKEEKMTVNARLFVDHVMFLDDDLQPVAKEKATWIKQWNADGTARYLQVIRPTQNQLTVPDVRQTESFDCGVAALLSVLQLYGTGLALDDLSQMLRTSKTDGTRPKDILRVAKELGLQAAAQPLMTLDDLQAWTDKGVPVLCPVQRGGSDRQQASASQGHWVVVTAVEGGKVSMQDPVDGPREVTADGWMDRWQDKDADGNRYLRFGIAVQLGSTTNVSKQQKADPDLEPGGGCYLPPYDPTLADGGWPDLTRNTAWSHLADADKLGAFKDWLAKKLKADVLNASMEDLLRRYAEAGFRKGAARAYDDFTAARRATATTAQGMAFYEGGRQAFLKDSFAQPVSVERVKVLAARSFGDLKGVTDAMSSQMSRTLLDGLVEGKSPRDVGRDLAKDVDGIGKVRGTAIARTEIVRAHAEGQLDALEGLGATHVGAAIEFQTVDKDLDEKDGGPCKKCLALQGVVLKIKEARGLIPAHISCRCCWTPANTGEDDADQKDTKQEIDAALEEAGIEDRDIDAVRPKSVFNSDLSANENNCGTGQGGFQPGNTCAAEGSSGKSKWEGIVVDGKVHKHAEAVKNQVAEMLGGVPEEKTADAGQRDKKPYDVKVPGKGGKPDQDVEVKSLSQRKNDALSVHADALLRKVRHQQRTGNGFHTVAVDDRDTYDGGKHTANYSGNRLWYKRGSGRYTLSQMHPCKDAAELRRLVRMKDADLPEKAKGTLPPPPPMGKLVRQAKNEDEKRSARNKARKDRPEVKEKLRQQARDRYAAKKAEASTTNQNPWLPLE